MALSLPGYNFSVTGECITTLVLKATRGLSYNGYRLVVGCLELLRQPTPHVFNLFFLFHIEEMIGAIFLDDQQRLLIVTD